MTQLALDTSVAVPYLASWHEAHHQVCQALAGKHLSICSHSLLESYSVLTRLPGPGRVTAHQAAELLDAAFTEVLCLPESEAAAIHRALADQHVAGGASYDGQIALTAKLHDAVLVSRDARALPTYKSLGVTVWAL